MDALKEFSSNFVKQYEPSSKRGTVEELEQRVSSLRLQLEEAETELETVRKGKQKV